MNNHPNISPFHHALKVDTDICTACSHCMRNCPTEAIRIRQGKAVIDPARCVDCGQCYSVCPSGAIYVEQDDFNDLLRFRFKIAIVPMVFWGQFDSRYDFDTIRRAIKMLGFDAVFPGEYSTGLLNELMIEYIHSHPDVRPLISCFCPAIVRLIQVRFPSLTPNLIPLRQPLDLTAIYLRKTFTDTYSCQSNEIGIFYITPCAAKIAAIKSPVGEEKSAIDGVLNLNLFYNRVRKILNTPDVWTAAPNEKTLDLSAIEVKWTHTGGEKNNMPFGGAAIDGMSSVIAFLEQVEDEKITGFDFLELRACDESCPGGILTVANRFWVVDRMQTMAKKLPDSTKSQKLEPYSNYLKQHAYIEPIEPRGMQQLDPDPRKAYQKLQHLENLAKMLPGIDCGVCGAPTCRALAEDVVNHQASISDCYFVHMSLGKNSRIPYERSLKINENIWGKKWPDPDFFKEGEDYDS